VALGHWEFSLKLGSSTAGVSKSVVDILSAVRGIVNVQEIAGYGEKVKESWPE